MIIVLYGDEGCSVSTIQIPFGDNQSDKKSSKKSSLSARIIVGFSSLASLTLILWPAPDQLFSISFIGRRLPFIALLVWQYLSLLGYSAIPFPILSYANPASGEERKVSPLGSGSITVLVLAGIGLLATLAASFGNR